MIKTSKKGRTGTTLYSPFLPPIFLLPRIKKWYTGVIWTHVISLHREDAERLGYNNAAAWKDLVRRNVTELAAAHQIDIDNLQWYAAFHDTAHHPHIHLLVYAKDAKQGSR